MVIKSNCLDKLLKFSIVNNISDNINGDHCKIGNKNK